MAARVVSGTRGCTYDENPCSSPLIFVLLAGWQAPFMRFTRRNCIVHRCDTLRPLLAPRGSTFPFA